MISSVSKETKFLHDLVNFGNPGNDAIIFYDEEKEKEIKITYERLQRFSSTFAEVLRKFGDGFSQTVGVFGEQNELLPLIILGILKAEFCFVYLPVYESPEYLSNWSRACGISIIVALNRNWKTYFPNFRHKTTFENTVHILCVNQNRDNVDNRIAYVMRTSGTTGQFKTVKVPHDAIVPNIVHLKNLFDVKETDAVFLASPFTFDPSVVEMFLAFYAGAKLLIVSDKIKTQPQRLAELLFTRYNATFLQMTPSLFLRFGDEIISQRILSEISCVRTLVLGGETFPVDVVERNWNWKNRTRIFNIYGITEVSCWATCAELDRVALKKGREVPLGEPLLETKMKIEWSTTNSDEKIGEIFVGGWTRRCLVGSETFDSAPEFRATGDFVKRMSDDDDDDDLYFVGRFDSQRKRFGKKINLEEINSAVSKYDEISQSFCFLKEDVLFAAVKMKNKQNDEQEIIKRVRSFVSAKLPVHSRPDRYFVVDEFPLTVHGKIDKKSLLETVSQLCTRNYEELKFSEENLLDGVLRFAKEILNLDADQCSLSSDSYLWTFGCDSLKSLQLVTKLERWCERSLPRAFEIIVYKTVNDLCDYLICSSSDETSTPKRILNDDDDSKTDNKNNISKFKKRKVSSSFADRLSFRVIQKANVLADGKMDAVLTFDDDLLSLTNVWQWNSGKCIDASPLLIDEDGGDTNCATVYVGSHSHQIASLNASNGTINWICNVDDRVEASANVTRCGSYLIIGSYDSFVYFIECRTGSIYWRFKTGDIIKCTAYACRSNDVVFVGSHDGNLYALNYAEKMVKWVVNVSSGVTSSPCTDSGENYVFVATLSGCVNCLSTDSGSVIWVKIFNKPIFSSLISYGDYLLVCCVDGFFYLIEHSNGNIQRQFMTSAPMFNAPSICSRTFSLDDKKREILFFGNQNGEFYCSEFDLNPLWTTKLDTGVSTSPFTFFVSLLEKTKVFVCVCSSKGTIYFLDSENGRVICQYKLPGEIFSSPVIWRNFVYVGCRDDKLYCLKICERTK